MHHVAEQDMYKSRSYLYDDDSARSRRMEAVSFLSSLLKKTGDLQDAGGGEQQQLYKQVCQKKGCPECQGPHLSSSAYHKIVHKSGRLCDYTTHVGGLARMS